MEHISRLTSRYMDVFFVVSDASRRGLIAAQRIWNLVDELKITVKRRHLILNRVRGEVSQEALDIISAEKMELAGVIPDDLVIYEADQAARPTSLLTGAGSPAVAAAQAIFEKTLG